MAILEALQVQVRRGVRVERGRFGHREGSQNQPRFAALMRVQTGKVWDIVEPLLSDLATLRIDGAHVDLGRIGHFRQRRCAEK